MDSTITLEGVSVSLSPVVEIAKRAGDIILDVYNSNTADWELQTKSDDSPLTRADLSANEHICSELKSLHPSIPIMSEENKNAPFSERYKWTHYWCVDPLDGTKEFVKRNGEFTVNIALMAAVDTAQPQLGAAPVLGIVYAPVLEKVYFAVKGCGAFIVESSQPEKQIRCAEFSEKDAGLTFVCSRSHLDERTQAFIEKYESPNKKSVGSSLKFMIVAEGAAHIYPRMAPTSEWDTAASQIIVEEAGGQVLDADSYKPMRYNKENTLNSFFVVYGNRTNLP